MSIYLSHHHLPPLLFQSFSQSRVSWLSCLSNGDGFCAGCYLLWSERLPLCSQSLFLPDSLMWGCNEVSKYLQPKSKQIHKAALVKAAVMSVSKCQLCCSLPLGQCFSIFQLLDLVFRCTAAGLVQVLSSLWFPAGDVFTRQRQLWTLLFSSDRNQMGNFIVAFGSVTSNIFFLFFFLFRPSEDDCERALLYNEKLDEVINQMYDCCCWRLMYFTVSFIYF